MNSLFLVFLTVFFSQALFDRRYPAARWVALVVVATLAIIFFRTLS